mmetsp:Transcript_31210/g.93101  ORF Transcript_31210/g.93101 Transcript_31210/m.93101 type:complete len:337 (-) Transcript_31210:5041-6051(-)
MRGSHSRLPTTAGRAHHRSDVQRARATVQLTAGCGTMSMPFHLTRPTPPAAVRRRPRLSRTAWTPGSGALTCRTTLGWAALNTLRGSMTPTQMSRSLCYRPMEARLGLARQTTMTGKPLIRAVAESRSRLKRWVRTTGRPCPRPLTGETGTRTARHGRRRAATTASTAESTPWTRFLVRASARRLCERLCVTAHSRWPILCEHHARGAGWMARMSQGSTRVETEQMTMGYRPSQATSRVSAAAILRPCCRCARPCHRSASTNQPRCLSESWSCLGHLAPACCCRRCVVILLQLCKMGRVTRAACLSYTLPSCTRLPPPWRTARRHPVQVACRAKVP